MLCSSVDIRFEHVCAGSAALGHCAEHSAIRSCPILHQNRSPPRLASRRRDPRLGTVSRDGSPACSRRLGSVFLAEPHLPRPHAAPARTGARGPDAGLPLTVSGAGVLSDAAAPGLSGCTRLLTMLDAFLMHEEPSSSRMMHASDQFKALIGDTD